MKLESYEQIVRHFDKFSKEKIYVVSVDKAIHEIVNVQTGSKGLEVITKDNKIVPVNAQNSVFNDLTHEQFYPKINKVKKKKEKKKKDDKQSKRPKREGEGRVWL